MTESQKLYRVFRRLHFTIDQARYSTRKLIECKRRVDTKFDNEMKEIPFFLSNVGVS